MSKYASILFSPEKYHEIAPFRFPVYEELAPGEAKGAEALNKKQSKSTYKSMRLAQRIAQDRKVTAKEALDILGKLGEDENQDLFFKYAEEVEALSVDSLSPTEQKIAYVTLFMRFRGETRIPPSKQWTRTSDWEEADTEAMPGKLLNAVFDLFTWERDGWPAEGNSEEPEVSAPAN